jgi:hypothetical protein
MTVGTQNYRNTVDQGVQICWLSYLQVACAIKPEFFDQQTAMDED